MTYPTDVKKVNADIKIVKKAFKDAGVPKAIVSAVETRALRSGRRQTGEFKSNRASRWKLKSNDPQYGSELDCKIIFLRLLGMVLAFAKAPIIAPDVIDLLSMNYVGLPVNSGTYRDALLLEVLDYEEFKQEAQAPKHGHSAFHIGHQDPTAVPKHVPDNIFWRTHRSNLIQGDMTLRQARIYIIKLIARYFELGELPI